MRTMLVTILASVTLLLLVTCVIGGPAGKSRPLVFEEDGNNYSSRDEPRCHTSRYGAGFCTTAAACAPFFHVITSSSEFRCPLNERGQQGYCCPETDPSVIRNTNIDVRANVELRGVDIGEVPELELRWAAGVGIQEMEDMITAERGFTTRGLVAKPGTAQRNIVAFFQTSTNETDETARHGFALVAASQALARKLGLTPVDAGPTLRRVSYAGTSLAYSCPREPSCPSSTLTFRTIDGSCNNLRRSMLGKSNTPFSKLLPPAYEDGIFLPRRTSVAGRPLPSARSVSAALEPERNVPLHGVSLYTMLWGQFIDHDLTLNALFRTPEGEMPTCCDDLGQPVEEVLREFPEGCFPIDVEPTDIFFGRQFNVQCLNFVRASPGVQSGCTLGFAKQINQLTHWLDGSMVYGSNEEQLRKVMGSGGKLDVIFARGKTEPLLPLNRFGVVDECTEPDEGMFCFFAGDVRSNEQIVLSVMHTLWVREHNRIVDELNSLNPRWDADRLFQEARRIVIAEIQHITYNEWLPLIIGTRIMYENNLTPKPRGFRYDYDETVDPASTSEFVTAAFRFGHSLLQGEYELFDERERVFSTIRLRDAFNNPRPLFRNGFFDGFVRGLALQKSQTFDTSFTQEIQRFLFAKGRPFGLDLVALNVQRGRDHAVRPYNDYREFCGLPRVKSFSDLYGIMQRSVVERLRRTYASVEDIDLFIGGVSESPAEGAIVGPTFQCIIAEQFARFKKADRFFYDLGNQPNSFNPQQLHEIRKSSLARIVCDNSNVRRIQPLIFFEASNINDLTECSNYQIPRLDLSNGWTERRY